MDDDEVGVPAARPDGQVVPYIRVVFEEVLEALKQGRSSPRLSKRAEPSEGIRVAMARGPSGSWGGARAVGTAWSPKMRVRSRRHFLKPLLGLGDSARAIYPRGDMVEGKNSKGTIDAQIHLIRGMSVMLDVDLATLYGVSPGALMQGVRRNRSRFPADFLFQLTNQDVANLKSQSVISSSGAGHGGRRHRHWALTSVLRSETAVSAPPRQRGVPRTNRTIPY
jgi:hypothetical protein